MNSKVGFCIVALFCVGATGAWGWGALVGSFASPGQYTDGLGYLVFSGVRYISVATSTPDRIWRLYRTTGSVYASYPSPTSYTMGGDSGIIGMTGYTWVVSQSPNYVYRMGFASGSVYGSFPGPSTSSWGVAFRDAGAGSYYIYYTALSRLYRMNATTGSVYASYSLPFSPTDLAFDAAHNCLWVGDSSGGRIRQMSLTGSNIASFAIGIPPFGVAFDGTYVLAGVSSPTHRINIYEVGGAGIAPASLGRVKALFR